MAVRDLSNTGLFFLALGAVVPNRTYWVQFRAPDVEVNGLAVSILTLRMLPNIASIVKFKLYNYTVGHMASDFVSMI